MRELLNNSTLALRALRLPLLVAVIVCSAACRDTSPLTLLRICVTNAGMQGASTVQCDLGERVTLVGVPAEPAPDTDWSSLGVPPSAVPALAHRSEGPSWCTVTFQPEAVPTASGPPSSSVCRRAETGIVRAMSATGRVIEVTFGGESGARTVTALRPAG